jgi:hypothetical protein
MQPMPRLAFAAPTRRSVFERAWNERAVALWRPGESPRSFDAWLLTAVLRARGSRVDRRLAGVARSARLLGCPRFEDKKRPEKVTEEAAVNYTAMPESLARFLRCEF